MSDMPRCKIDKDAGLHYTIRAIPYQDPAAWNRTKRLRRLPRQGYDLVDRQLGDGGRMDHAPPDQPSDAASTDEWPVRNAALGDPHAPPDRPPDAASPDPSSPTTSTDTSTTETWPLLDASNPTTPPDTPTTETWPLLSRWTKAAGVALVVVYVLFMILLAILLDLLLGE